MKWLRLLLSLLCFAGLAPLRADESAAQLARQSRTVREHYCGRCHGVNSTAKADFGFILNTRQLIATKLIVPGDPDGSELLARIREGSMPPEGAKQRPTPAEILVLEKWIRAGAPADETETPVRPFRTERDILTAIRLHLSERKEADRPFQRYFSLLNLHNSADVSARDLRLYRAAVAKLLTTLSGPGHPDAPREVDSDGTVLAVDLRRLGWDKKNLWQEVLRFYPYGLVYQDSANAELRAVAKEIAALGDRECELPYVRADWFVATASHSLLSGELLRLLDPADKNDRIAALHAYQADRNGPIALLAHRYQRDLRPGDVACELGLRDTKRIHERQHDTRLAPILAGTPLKRETWTSRGEGARTLFQQTASALDLGTPYVP